MGLKRPRASQVQTTGFEFQGKLHNTLCDINFIRGKLSLNSIAQAED